MSVKIKPGYESPCMAGVFIIYSNDSAGVRKYEPFTTSSLDLNNI
jgi:hypothetical protein